MTKKSQKGSVSHISGEAPTEAIYVKKYVVITCAKFNKSSAVAEMGDRLVTIDMGRKSKNGLLWGWVTTGSPPNTMWPVPRPTSLPSGILIHSSPTV